MMRILVVGLCVAFVLAVAVPSGQAYVAAKGKRSTYSMGGPAMGAPGMCPPSGCPTGPMPMQMGGYAGPITKCKPTPMACGPMPCPPPCGPMPCPPPCGPMPCPPPCDSGGSPMAWY